jgi:hypothetical protein
MLVAAHHALLGAAAAALLGAGIRAASLAVPGGLERVIAAVVLAAAAAVVQALGLGLLGWGTSPVALPLAALATWLAARVWLPAPGRRVYDELVAWWGRLGRPAAVGLGALMGLFVAWTAWVLAYPVLGADGVVYHLTEIVGWVHSGHPGAIQLITYEFPVGNYPLTDEVLIAWGMGISRSFVPVSLSTPAAMALLAVAGWAGLRRLRVPGHMAALALIALCSSPLVVAQLTGPETDLPALAWLASVAVLCASSSRHPGLLAPAIVGAGLAVGTKTTVLPLVALALGVALVRNRALLRTLVLPLALAGGLAFAVGGIWYLRNLIEHGSPFWPFTPAPWGDPRPRFLERVHQSFLDRPRASLRGRLGLYSDNLAGSTVLVAGALLAPLVARRRVVLAAAAVTALGLIAWASAPFTGIADLRVADLSLSTTRYLVSTFAAAALTLALAAREGRTASRVVAAVLLAVLAWNVVRLVGLGEPFVPPGGWVIVGVAAGAALAAVAAARVPRLDLGGIRAGAALAAACALLAVPASGYVARHGRTHETLDVGLARWFAKQRAFARDSRPVSLVPTAIGVLSGDRLRHRVELIPPDATCADLHRRAREGWVVVRNTPPPDPFKRDFPNVVRALDTAICLAAERPVYDDGVTRVYAQRP